MSADPQDIGQSLLHAALAAGADAADAVVIREASTQVDVRESQLEKANRSEETEIGLRVLIGKQQALVSSSDTARATIEALAERAVFMAREAPEDPYAGLAAPEQLATSIDLDRLELVDPAPAPDAELLQRDAMEAQAAASAVKGVSQVQGASGAYYRSQVHMSATNGFSGGYERTYRTISCAAIAGTGTGMQLDYDSDGRVFQSELRPAGDIGRLAGERAVAQLDPQKPATGTYSVVFDERIAGSLVGHLLSAINGSSVARGSSWLLDALGQQVLPEVLSIVEDPFRPRIPGSRPFDGEGLSTRKRVIVENGVLTGWTLDLATGRKLGMESTGNAARGTSSPPSPSNWNIALTQGDRTQSELLSDMGTGLLVTSLIGSTINPNTGDYSRGASGFWVEKGEIAYPVNECTIAGNLRDMLLRIVPGNDARTHLTRVVPSILIEGMTLAGT